MSPDPALQRARSAKAAVAERLRGNAAVNGVGVAREGNGWAVRVNLREPVADDEVPAEMDGVAVHCRIVGEIVPRAS